MSEIKSLEVLESFSGSILQGKYTFTYLQALAHALVDLCEVLVLLRIFLLRRLEAVSRMALTLTLRSM